MFGREDFFERREERHDERMERKLHDERMENYAYAEYNRGQMDGVKEGEKVGYERGFIDGKARGIDICIQILANNDKSLEVLAEEFNLPLDIVRKILKSS